MSETGPGELLTIGAFSLRCGLSVATLRRYDEAGLLPARHVDPHSGYRWYDPGQVRLGHLIRLLRVLDVPVATIAELLDDPDLATAVARLDEHWARVERRVAEGRRIAAFVTRSLGGAETAVFHVETKQVPEQTVLGRRRVVAIPELVGFICTSLDELQVEAERAGLPVAGPGMTLYYAKVDDETDGEVQVCLPVQPGDGVDVTRLSSATSVDTLPGGTVASTLAVGPEQARYPAVLDAYAAVTRWSEEHSRVLSGPPREIAHGPERLEIAWLLHEE